MNNHQYQATVRPFPQSGVYDQGTRTGRLGFGGEQFHRSPAVRVDVDGGHGLALVRRGLVRNCHSDDGAGHADGPPGGVPGGAA
ncbi:hypothetical protein ACIP93_07925 [Streptomyces sp. NPDC088745]|uniref:hypothetical protein n=1 Tax=Streptomyces sp. NPDC088745 TaxID=3365884 RepID=UPI003825B168